MINSNYITFNFTLNFCKRDNLNQTKIIMKIGISSFILKNEVINTLLYIYIYIKYLDNLSRMNHVG